jgi:hypothetical protein
MNISLCKGMVSIFLFLVCFPVVAVQAQETVVDGVLVRLKIETGKQKNNPANFFKSKNNQDRRSADSFATDRYYRYAQLEKGDTYRIAIDLKDKSKKVLIGIAVDDINVVTGNRIDGDIEKIDAWENGYILDQTQGDVWDKVAGWRDGDIVRQFVVTEFKNSVATDIKDDSAPGTIVIAVFRGDSEKPLSRTRSQEGGKGLGTGAGDAQYDPIEVGSFAPKERAYEVFIIKYENRNTLQDLGVLKSNNKFWIDDEKERPTVMKMKKRE